jgi:hypothetical protein
MFLVFTQPLHVVGRGYVPTRTAHWPTYPWHPSAWTCTPGPGASWRSERSSSDNCDPIMLLFFALVLLCSPVSNRWACPFLHNTPLRSPFSCPLSTRCCAALQSTSKEITGSATVIASRGLCIGSSLPSSLLSASTLGSVSRNVCSASQRWKC